MPFFTMHAREQMLLRHIGVADVENVLSAPSGAPWPGRRGDTLVVPGMDMQGLPLYVVVSATDMNRVVTVRRRPG